MKRTIHQALLTALLLAGPPLAFVWVITIVGPGLVEAAQAQRPAPPPPAQPWPPPNWTPTTVQKPVPPPTIPPEPNSLEARVTALEKRVAQLEARKAGDQ